MENIEVSDHVTKVIRYHPKYYEHYVKTHKYLMYDDGPLPFATRHYLAIIAAARNKCNYLVNLHEKEFLEEGGDKKWLKGLDFIPQKLRAIYDINKILAHRPWLLTKEHIERLTKGTNSWSLAEVVHAIVILAHFHSLSSFVFSCGLNQELDASLKNEPESPSSTSDPELEAESKSNTIPFVQRLKLKQEKMFQLMRKQQQEENNKKILQQNNNQQLQLQQQQQPLNNGSNASDHNIETLMKRMQDLSEKKNNCSEAEHEDHFNQVSLNEKVLSGAKI
jgi:sestrin 1/3